MTEAAVKINEETEFEAQLPKPVGYRLLIALPQVAETLMRGQVSSKPTLNVARDHIMSIIGLVVDMGNDARMGMKHRFPDGPWCKQGDYVMFRMNSGTRFTIGGTEYRLMNDDSH